MDTEQAEPQEVAALEEEAKQLESRPCLVKLEKDDKEFYFDSMDLPNHRGDFMRMRQEGWRVTDQESLAAYHPARKKHIEEQGFEPDGWGYKKHPVS